VKFNWEEFKRGNVRVRCKTENECINFINECYKRKIEWDSCLNWDKNTTCYHYSQSRLQDIVYSYRDYCLGWNNVYDNSIMWSDYMEQEKTIWDEIAEGLGKEINEEFEVTYCPYKFRITYNGLQEKYMKGWIHDNGADLKKILENPIVIIKKPKLNKITDRQMSILNALYILGFKWIAKDKENGIFAYSLKPVKYSIRWYFDSKEDDDCENKCCIGDFNSFPMKELFNLVSWEDEEPLEIKKALKKVLNK